MNSYDFFLRFECGMPKGTAQQKGERIIYKNGRPVIQHFKKDKVSTARQEFKFKLSKHRPKEPTTAPVALTVVLYFDIKERRLWGRHKTTRPDCDNYIKELKDAMTDAGFWYDDAQVVDLRIVKYYAEKATIYIRVEELGS